jgi:hypothetical protein
VSRWSILDAVDAVDTENAFTVQSYKRTLGFRLSACTCLDQSAAYLVVLKAKHSQISIEYQKEVSLLHHFQIDIWECQPARCHFRQLLLAAVRSISIIFTTSLNTTQVAHIHKSNTNMMKGSTCNLTMDRQHQGMTKFMAIALSPDMLISNTSVKTQGWASNT